MANGASTQRPEKADRDDIQGNLVGFNKDRQRLLFLNFPNQESGRKFLTDVHPEVVSAADVLRINADYKKFVKEEGHDPTEFDTGGINVALTAAGLTAISAPEIDTFPAE